MSISLLDALQITEDSSIPFGIKFVSFDESRKKGGEIIELNDCVRVGASHSMKNNDTISVKQRGMKKHPYTVHTHMILEVNNQEVFV